MDEEDHRSLLAGLSAGGGSQKEESECFRDAETRSFTESKFDYLMHSSAFWVSFFGLLRWMTVVSTFGGALSKLFLWLEHR